MMQHRFVRVVVTLAAMLVGGIYMPTTANAAPATRCWWMTVDPSNFAAVVWGDGPSLTSETMELTVSVGGVRTLVGTMSPTAGAVFASGATGIPVSVRSVTSGLACSYVGSPALLDSRASQVSVDAIASSIAAIPTPNSTVAINSDQYAAILGASGSVGSGTVVEIDADQFYILGGLLSVIAIIAIGSMVYQHGRRSSI